MTYVVFLVVNTRPLFRMESLFQEIDQSRHSIYDQVRGNGTVVLRNGVYFASDGLHGVFYCAVVVGLRIAERKIRENLLDAFRTPNASTGPLYLRLELELIKHNTNIVCQN